MALHAIRRSTVPVIMMMLAGALLHAQTTTGRIVGRITDPSNAVVPSADVTLLNDNTGISTRTQCSSDGEYTFSNVEPGSYNVTVTAPGFQTAVRSNISVFVNQTVREDIVLTVGEVATKVEVKATAAVVQSDASSVGTVIDGTQVENMPLNGRGDIFTLLSLAPGVQGSGSNPLIAGGTWYGSTNMTVDGVSDNDIGNERLVGPIPSMDAVAEFRVIANGAPAEFGFGGSQIVMATKSGTNEYHGSLFAFNRNRALAAKNFFATGLPKAPYNRNEFGGTIGGPVVKNKLFFFGSYEGLRLRQSTTLVRAMPTVALKAGDFSGLPTIKDPYTGLPFAGNKIPADRISSVSSALLAFSSNPNLPGTGAAGLGNNFAVNLPRREDMDRYSGRADYQITSNDRVSGRYYHVNDGPFPAAVSGTDKYGNWGGFGIATRNAMASYTRIISPAMVNEVRAGFNQEVNFRTPQNPDFDPSKLIPGLISPVPGLGGLPTVNITGFTGYYDLPGSGDRKRNYQVYESLTWMHGHHAVKAGFQFERASAFNFQNPPPPRGSFTFDGRYTGQPFADFLLGVSSATGRVSKNGEVEPLNNRYAAYVQDDWTVSPRLTLNLGLRYEYAGLIVNSRGDMSNFYPNLNEMVVLAGTPNPRLMAALPVVLGNKVGLDTSNYENRDRNNWGPRLGFAYRPLGTTRFVVRGSYGIYYNVIWNYSTASLGLNPPFLLTESFEPQPGSVPSLTFSNPFPGNGNIPASPSITAISGDRRNPYQQQWNTTFEYELLPNLAVRASYLGNKGTHLEQSFNLNDPPPAPGQVQPRRPFQPWGAITYIESGRDSITHQMQLGAVKRFSSGLAFEFEYQFTRALGPQTYGQPPMDNRNVRLDRGNLDFIQKHYWTGNYTYDLPFGKGKRWLESLSGPADKLIGGWRLSGITSYGSGQPYSVTFTSTVLGWPSSRADIVGNPAPAHRDIQHWFNPAAFAVPAPFTYGNSARNMLWGPSSFYWDAGIFKNMNVTERVIVEFRAEFFNILNHPNFGLPAADITVPATVGRITSATDPRSVQFGLKLLF